jgi:hypothetical protein
MRVCKAINILLLPHENEQDEGTVKGPSARRRLRSAPSRKSKSAGKSPLPYRFTYASRVELQCILWSKCHRVGGSTEWKKEACADRPRTRARDSVQLVGKGEDATTQCDACSARMESCLMAIGRYSILSFACWDGD